MNIPEILPCPNPECKAECGDFYFIPEHPDDSEDGKHPVNDPVIQVQCSKCQYSGPMIKIIGHDTLTATQEAIRLHNAICAPAVQATADEAAREICKLYEDYAVGAGAKPYPYHLERIIRKAVSPKAAQEDGK